MAADSRVSVGAGTSYPADKIVRVKSMIVGACGHAGDCTRFLEWAKREFRDPVPKWHIDDDENDECIFALVLRKDGLYAFTPGDPEPEKIKADVFAIGSGGKAARVALKLGKKPEEAVALACEVDDYSGPPITVMYLDEKN